MEELLGYEIESILLNRVKDVFSHHQKIIDVCEEFLNTVSHFVEKQRTLEDDSRKEIGNNATIIANITNQMINLQDESATVSANEKILENQIDKTIQQQEKLKEDIKEELAQEEIHAHEIVEIQQESEETKKKKKLKWDGVKRASKAYKSALQFDIEITDSSEGCDKIRINFFKSQNEENPQYYVDLTYAADLWRVDLIHPPLTQKHEERLKSVVNFKKQQKLADLTAFLCTLRKLFKQQRKS